MEEGVEGGGRVCCSELLCAGDPRSAGRGHGTGGAPLLLLGALGRARLRRGPGWLCHVRGILMMLFPSPFLRQKQPFCREVLAPVSGCGGSVEKEAWQCRVKISGFVPFAVTRARLPPLQQHEELAVGVMEEQWMGITRVGAAGAVRGKGCGFLSLCAGTWPPAGPVTHLGTCPRLLEGFVTHLCLAGFYRNVSPLGVGVLVSEAGGSGGLFCWPCPGGLGCCSCPALVQ